MCIIVSLQRGPVSRRSDSPAYIIQIRSVESHVYDPVDRGPAIRKLRVIVGGVFIRASASYNDIPPLRMPPERSGLVSILPRVSGP